MRLKKTARWILRRADTTLLDAIAVHKNSLVRKAKAGRLSVAFWSALQVILAPLVLRHKPPFHAVISADPTDAKEALHKALYVMAVVLSERESLDREQVQQVAASLAPFRRETLASLMAGESDAATANYRTAGAADPDISATAD
jgi:hypothetical protein